MRITLLGSCRQQPIQMYHDTTSVQEDLTYPHYTKEVIQTIRFCRDWKQFPQTLTQYLFRKGLMTKQPLSTTQCVKIQQDFNSSDIFVIEIASRLCYEYQGHYAHHIAYDEGDYRICQANNINKRELTDEEIRQDLVTIKGLLHPKKILIVPHIYTRTHGKRYELVQLLKHLCDELELPYLDVSKELEAAGYMADQVYQPEPVLAHFTAVGKRAVAEIYRKKLREIEKA